MKLIHFRIPGEVVGQGRPRMRTVKTKDGRSFASAYDPAKSRSYKALIQDIAAREMAYSNAEVITGPVSVSIVAAKPWPRSQWRKRTPRGCEWWTGKPDIDNIAKAILDAMSGVVYLDDTQVCEISITKMRPEQGNPGGVTVDVVEIEREPIWI